MKQPTPANDPLPRWPVSLNDVPPLGLTVLKGAGDVADYAALARHLGGLSAADFRLDVLVKPVAGDGLSVHGEARLTLVQSCVVTLEPIESKLVAPIEVTFLPRSAIPEPEEYDDDAAMPEDDPPDVLENDTVELGPLAAEFLLLAVDPYPRKPGAQFGVQGDGEGPSPFAALAALKPKQD